MRTSSQAAADRPACPWHAIGLEEVLRSFVTDAEQGLTKDEAASRLVQGGANALKEDDEEPWRKEALESLTEPLQLLLIAVASLYFWFGETGDALTILAVIITVAAIEVVSEVRAKRAVAALSTLGAPNAMVVRDGQMLEVPSRDVVIGDLVLLNAGHRVPADVRLLQTAALRIDESALTGESVPIMKSADHAIAAQASLGDRDNMAFAGTVVTVGKGKGVVVAVGAMTEVGRIAGLVRTAREPRTPLQQSLQQLSKWLLWVAVAFSVLVPLLGVVLAGRPAKEMVLVGLTLAFATIPEELPILITLVLGLGAYRLSQRQAIVRRLRAAETLGSVSVVATDKTGTLTENAMRLAEVWVDGKLLPASESRRELAFQRLLVVGVLASDIDQSEAGVPSKLSGDPMNVALLRAARDAGLNGAQLWGGLRVVREYPFTADRKRMSVVAADAGRGILACKGAPESVLDLCTAMRVGSRQAAFASEAKQTALQQAEAMAARGLRVLALAQRQLVGDGLSATDVADVERDMEFVGLVGLQDPPRPEARQAVQTLREAGVRVLMLTGDHPATAVAIANQVGIEGAHPPVVGVDIERQDEASFRKTAITASVFARISPEHKLRVVRELQAAGEVVAVTGDGVNDAPALREAAVGVTMGRGGTDVAREAADLILADDNFGTVVEAVRTGRVLFGNLRKAVRYYLAAKVALVLASLTAVLLKLPVPFEPVQIIVMELFMDLGASLTFVSEPPEDDVMKRPPRHPQAKFMDRAMQVDILLGGLTLALVVLTGYLGSMAMGATLVQAQTAAFGAWMLGHVVLAAHMRAERQLLVTSFWSNKAFLAWAGAAWLFTLVVSVVPWLRDQVHMAALEPATWTLVVTTAVLLPAWWEGRKWTRKRRS